MGERQEFSNIENWHNRGYLPHYDAVGKYQMVTYRLADSLPQEVLKKLQEDLTLKEDSKKRKLLENYLDQGYGSCLLKNSQVAQIVIDAWKFHNGKKYDLIAYVVMPNHVHLLIKTYEGFALKNIVHSWKSFTSKEIQKLLKPECAGILPAEIESKEAGKMPAVPGKENKIWQEEYWDRFIRDENHFQKCVTYILENPVKAGLVKNWQDWPWSFVRTSKK